MKTLSELLENTPVEAIWGDPQVAVGSLVYDSRAAAAGCCFFAVPGTQCDGHAFIGAAITAGAAAVVCARLPEARPAGVPFVVVKDSQGAMADMAAAFYDHPSRELKLVGITGTNSKTTTVTLLFDLVRAMGYRAGLISPVVYRIEERPLPQRTRRPTRSA